MSLKKGKIKSQQKKQIHIKVKPKNVSNLTPVPYFVSNSLISQAKDSGGVLPYTGYIGMCGPKGYGFSAVLVINRVSNLADSGHK